MAGGHGGDRPYEFPFKGVLYVQAALLLFVAVAPFGFDRPSSWGLDIGHFLLLAAMFCGLALIGLIGAIAQKNWKWLLVQGAVVVAAPAAVVLNDLMDRLLRR